MLRFYKLQQDKLDAIERQILAVERVQGVDAARPLRKRWLLEYAVLQKMRD